MSCSKCKQKVQQPIKPIEVNGQVELVDTTVKPDYTREDVIRAKDYFISRVKTEQERNWVYDFYFRQYGERLTGYCDIVCQNRVKARMDKLLERLNLYELSTNKK